MKIKSLFTLILAFVTTIAAAQSGGVEGRVLSRTDRQAVADATVTLLPINKSVQTASDGHFFIGEVPAGSYTLQLEANEFEPLTLAVRVGKLVRDLQAIVLVPTVQQEVLDDSIFAEFDVETASDANSLPTSLSASKDVFNSIASYNFSEMRFNVRGYDSQYQDVYLNGIRLNDALTGYSPWSLWSGLNDATRNQEVTTGLSASEVGVGGIGGVTNINTMPSQMRKGLRASLVNANQSYRFRAMVTYASGAQDNGWAYAFSLSTRQGGNDYVDGVYYNAFGYFAAVEKQFGSRHRLALTVMGAPTERGAQQASVQEVYDLVGNNYYNPNWGWQNGEMRNARVRDNHEPIAMLNYTFHPTERTRLDLAASYRFGRNGYSALTWQNGPDPRPDYYRYLPSYFVRDNNLTGAAWQAEYWMANYDNIRHINWDNMYQTNYLQNDPVDAELYGAGRRSNYMVEERHTDQRDWNLVFNFSHLFRNNAKINGGVALRRNRTEYYSEVKDLLGGDYWADIDKFAERDFASNPLAYQNNVDYYNKHGHAHAAKVGDKYSYDYYAHVVKGSAWATFTKQWGGLNLLVGGEVGMTNLWREGLWQKGLFMDNSKGDSEKLDFVNYKGKLNLAYRFSAAHTVELNGLYMQQAPEFRSAFVSPRTRNTVTPNLEEEKILSVDASYNLRVGDLRARISGYYTEIKDQTKVMSYYDDVAATFTNFAMSGIDKRHFGVEAAAQIPLVGGLSLKTAVSYGQYTYTSNPDYIQTQDNSAEVVSTGKVYWEDFRVESTPQLAASVGLSYRSNKNLFLSLDCNYYDNMYLSMSPIYRTDEVITSGMSREDIAYIRHQEKFDSAYVLNASIGKNWSIQRKYTLGFSLSIDNILNDQEIKTGGYEQTRLAKNDETAVTTYQPFDSKYFYMFGTTYYLNIYFRF